MNEYFWLGIGLFSQGCFVARFGIQWLRSERKGESYIPKSFWYLSVVGGSGLLVYAIYREEPVFVLGQAFGLIVYLRNLHLLKRV